MKNQLYYGDNLDVLRNSIPDESVDLCYLDPPFNSNRVYNVLFQTKTGDDAEAQIQAFDDTWTWSQATEQEYRDLIGGGAPAGVIDALEAMRRLLGDNDLLAYLVMMSSRLVELHRVLKPTGSLFLHCDPTASHYLKILLDAIFGPGRFRNEIVWCYTGPGSPGQRQFSRKHDIIFWYAKGESWTFNGDAVRLPHDEKTQQNYKPGLQGSGFVGADHVIHEKGKIPEDYWQIAIAPRGKEYLGYPTQKPIKLLERIVLAASNPGDVVLDPFCGCGTALDAAQKLGRSWIGIDITFIAIDLIEHRLEGAYGSDIKSTYEVHGIPRDLEGAARLFEESHFEFERWAVSLVDGTPKDKPGGDKGIDGVVRFLTGATEIGRAVVSVKGGKSVSPTFVRDLDGTITHAGAEMGILVMLADPTPGMLDAVRHSGSYTLSANGQQFPRLQIATIDELLRGEKPKLPPVIPPYRKATKRNTHAQDSMF